MMSGKWLYSLLIGSFLSAPALCETNGGFNHSHQTPLPISADLTLHEVVEKTWQRNPRIQVIQARLKHLEALEKKATSLIADDPRFSVNHYNDLLMNDDGLQEWEVGLEIPLWLPGQKYAQQKSIEQRRNEVTVSQSAIKLQLAGIVRELLWQIALNKNSLEIAKQEWKTVKKLEQDVAKRVELGDLAQSDLILAKQETLAKEAALRQAEQEYRHAQHHYDMVTDLHRIPKDFKEEASRSTHLQNDHPALSLALEKVASQMALRNQIMIEKRDNPSLFIGTRHERGSTDEDFANAIGLHVNIPIGLHVHTTPKLTAAELELTRKQSELELLRRKLDLQIQDTHRELLVTREQYAFAQRDYALSKKHLKMARKAFELGELSLLDLIRIQAKAFAAEQNLREKKLEIGLMTARFNQALGILP